MTEINLERIRVVGGESLLEGESCFTGIHGSQGFPKIWQESVRNWKSQGQKNDCGVDDDDASSVYVANCRDL